MFPRPRSTRTGIERMGEAPRRSELLQISSQSALVPRAIHICRLIEPLSLAISRGSGNHGGSMAVDARTALLAIPPGKHGYNNT
jgi:hypothetical protein